MERGLPALALKLGSRVTCLVLQRLIVVPEAPPQPLREQAPDRCLPSTHHADQHDMLIPELHACKRKPGPVRVGHLFWVMMLIHLEEGEDLAR
jgi:hypothetical protein